MDERVDILTFPMAEEIIVKHFKDNAMPMVTATIILGKSVTGKGYIPAYPTISFDVRNQVYEGDDSYSVPVPVDFDDVVGMIREKYGKMGLDVTDVGMVGDPENPMRVNGFKVTTMVKEKTEGKGSMK